MATFTDNTSSNGMSNNWVAKVEYNTTAYAGYTLVEAKLYLTVKYGWGFTLNNEYSLTIDGNKVTGSGKTISQTDSGGNGVTYTLLTHSVKVYHTSNKTITISGTVDANNIYYKSGGYYVGTYSLSQNTTLVPLTTKCIAPTTFTVSPNDFEDNIILSWSGASGGTGNSISYYYIQYAVSSDNSTWGSWTGLKSIASSSTSGSYTVDMSSKVSRGSYIKFQIRTEGSAGSSYYSAYKASSSIRRKPYTVCVAPTYFTISQDVSSNDGFNTSVTLEWSGASGGTNNAISSYLIEYSVCDDNASFYNWTTLQTISTTKTSYSLSNKDISSQVARGKWVKFRIRTQGTAGSSYYSGYKASNSLRRNPYTKCIAPTNVTVKSEADINGNQYTDIFNNQITISWASGGAGENNDIKRYYIEYCVSDNKANWSGWDILQSSDLTPKGTTSTTVNVSTKVDRGIYVKFRIRTEGTVMTKGADGNYLYYSNYVESPSIKRNSIPNAPTTFTISSHPTLEFSKGEAINLQWNKPKDIDDNIFRYRIQYAIGSKNNVSNNIINNSWSNLATIDNKNTLEWTISATNSLFEQITNYTSDNSNSLIQFRLQVVDVFQEYNNGNSSYYTYSPIVTRYDMTGVAIGINDKWVNCQLFIGKNGSWVEQSVGAGINNTWVDAGL